MRRGVGLLAPLLVSAAWACASGTPGPAAASATRASSLYDRPWRFTDERGNPVTLAAWRGTPLVLTMFYRGCNLRCPTTIRKLRRMESIFAQKNVRANIVMVTLDPRNDTPDRLLDFKRAERMDDATWHLLAGGFAETREVARLLSVHPAYDDVHIDHDVRIAILDADGYVTLELEGWSFDEGNAVAAALHTSSDNPAGSR